MGIRFEKVVDLIFLPLLDKSRYDQQTSHQAIIGLVSLGKIETAIASVVICSVSEVLLLLYGKNYGRRRSLLFRLLHTADTFIHPCTHLVMMARSILLQYVHHQLVRTGQCEGVEKFGSLIFCW